MLDRSARDITNPPAPVLAGASYDAAPIDRAHLFHMTLGDTALEREVLELFDHQIDLILARMSTAPAPVVATLAHTLKGSARGIGAPGVVAAAEAIEAATREGREIGAAIDDLATAGRRAQDHIRGMRQNEAGSGHGVTL
jgi:HPt (histidine-containing phosphotransfer) domain-containing protein